MSGRRASIDHFSQLDLTNQSCPLCHHQSVAPYTQDRRRPYLRCPECALVFVPDAFLISKEEEKREYDFHQNDHEDEGYQRFLMRCYQPVTERIETPSVGLDFGCGPAPLLAKLLMDAGHEMSVYDLFYWPDAKVLHQDYDFITCTEVIEHVAKAEALFPLWLSMLRPSGLLAIMTKRVVDQVRFKQWHYKNDPTHIRFYSDETFVWLGKKFDISIIYQSQDVVIFQRK